MLRTAGEHGMGQEEDDWLEAVSASDCVSTGRQVSSPLWHCVPLAHLAGDICLSSAFLHNITLATIIAHSHCGKYQEYRAKLKYFVTSKIQCQADNDGHN